MEDHVLNTSDHLPIYLKMSLNNMKVNTEHKNDRNIINHVKWRHLSEDHIKTLNIKLEGSIYEYTANNIDQLSEINDMSCKSIDNMYRDVVQLLVNATNHLPFIRKNNGTAWVQTGRPRDDDSQVWINYKKYKKLLRNQLRQSPYQYEVDYIRK